jgi:glycosyltransferase involved in cell wall biosynthesis
MSDVMPYPSKCFSDLNENELIEYENCFAQKVRNCVQRFNPDIIHSHHLWILSSLARNVAPGLPIVTTCHGSDLRQFRKCVHLQDKILAGCSRLDAIMSLSEAQKKEIAVLYHLPMTKIHVVGAGYNDRLFTPQEKPPANPVRLVYAGKLSYAKGVPWLLRALSKIQAPPWRLHLVGGGSGEEQRACLKLAHNLGDRATVHGSISQQDLAAIMRQSHIFVLPSFYEGLPLVVLEALACGCRVIATNLPGINEILGNLETNLVSLVNIPRLHAIDSPVEEDEKQFEDDLENALKAQIKVAMAQPQIDLSPIADTMVSFSWAGVFERVQAVYSKTLNNFENR